MSVDLAAGLSVTLCPAWSPFDGWRTGQQLIAAGATACLAAKHRAISAIASVFGCHESALSERGEGYQNQNETDPTNQQAV